MQRAPGLAIVFAKEEEGASDCFRRLFVRWSASDGGGDRCSTCRRLFEEQRADRCRRAATRHVVRGDRSAEMSLINLRLGRGHLAARKVKAQGSDSQIGLLGNWNEDVAPHPLAVDLGAVRRVEV